MTKEQYEAKTMKSPCAICGKYGHWKREHLPDGSLPAHAKAVDKPSKENPQPYYSDEKTNENGGSSKSKKTVSFNSAMVTNEDKILLYSVHAMIKISMVRSVSFAKIGRFQILKFQ